MKTSTATGTPANPPAEVLRVSPQWFTRVKKEAASGSRIWITGASGTGKSFILHTLKGFDLDWVGIHKDSKWTLDVSKFPKITQPIVGGSFSVPTYTDFVKLWKPDVIYSVTCSMSTYQRTFLRKAAEKACGETLQKACGIPISADFNNRFHKAGEALNPSVLKTYLDHEVAKVAATGARYSMVFNDHDDDRGGAWDTGTDELTSFSSEIIGLIALAADNPIARTLLRKRAPDPKYNPYGWRYCCYKFRKWKIKLDPATEAAYKKLRKPAKI